MHPITKESPALAPLGRRDGQTLRCSLCGQEILSGEEYWLCNGACVCGDCLPEFARLELAPCRLRRGREGRL